MNSISTIKDLTGDYPVYPGHALVVAWEIMSIFDTPAEALKVIRDARLNCPAAVADSRISGGGGEVYAACDLLKRAQNGASAEELMAWADERWVSGNAGGHADAVQSGLAQASRLKEGFPAKLAKWLAVEVAA